MQLSTGTAVPPTGVEEDVWATVLVLIFLETRLADSSGVWEMMADKAKAWLAATAAIEALEDFAHYAAAQALIPSV